MSDYIRAINDWEEANNSLLPQQFKDTDIQKIVNALNQQTIETQSVILSLLREYWLDTAIGKQLDVLGDYVDLKRMGRDDGSYRTLIGIKININNSTGTREDLISTIVGLYNATIVEVKYQFPAGIEVFQNGDIGLVLAFDFELDDGSLLELSDGSIFEVSQPDNVSTDLIFDVIPAGVGLTFLSQLELSDGSLLELSDGSILGVT